MIKNLFLFAIVILTCTGLTEARRVHAQEPIDGRNVENDRVGPQ